MIYKLRFACYDGNLSIGKTNKTMKYWIITDTHFGHDKMIEYCGRPLEFENLILQNLSKCVNETDLLIHLGDICYWRDEYWHSEIQKIKCAKWLVKGNHDSKSISWYLAHGWNFVGNSFTLDIFGGEILFSHTPVKDTGYFMNIHGHFHNNEKQNYEPELKELLTDKHILLSMENNNYLPYNLKTIVDKFKKNQISPIIEI